MPFSEIDRREHDEGVEEAEGRGRGRVGQVVGRDVDGLHRGDGALLGRGDPLLQGAHLGGQGRLVAHVRRHAAQQGRDLGAGLGEAEDVVDEQQRVGAGGVAEPLGHRQGRQGDAQAGAGRLVHLAEAHHGLSMTDLPVLPILASCISSQRSLPSRVRSPTPAKTE